MSEERDGLIQKAEDAVTALFSDMNVPQSETASDLKDLKGFIDTMLDALE